MQLRTFLASAFVFCACSSQGGEIPISTHIRGAKTANESSEKDTSSTSQATLRSSVLTKSWQKFTSSARKYISPMAYAPRDPIEFTHQVQQIQEDSLAEIETVARSLTFTDPQLWPLVRSQLLAPRSARKADYRTLLSVIGGDVPDRYGRFERSWKRDHGYKVKLSEDWFEDLLAVHHATFSHVLQPVYRDCVLQSALLQAAANIAKRKPELAEEIIYTLLETAYFHEGTFRDEVGRAIRRIGDEGVPYLFQYAAINDEKSQASDPEKADLLRRQQYARYQLDRMNRLHPEHALASVRHSPRMLAKLLQVYGQKPTIKAIDPLLAYVDAASPSVRKAARTALLAYGNDPSTQQATTEILTKFIASQAPQFFSDTCGEASANASCRLSGQALIVAYFSFLDKQQIAEQRQQIQAALANSDTAALLTQADQLLIQGLTEPLVDDASALAQRLAEEATKAYLNGDRNYAARQWRKAAALLQDDLQAKELFAQALAAEAELSTEPEGASMLLRRANELAPENSQISAALHRYETGEKTSRVTFWSYWLFATALLGIGLLILGLLSRSFRSLFWSPSPTSSN